MDVDILKQASLEFIMEQYRKYLNSLNINQNSISNTLSESFYLWRNKGKDSFWAVVTSDDFDNKAREELTSIVTNKSSGNINSLVSTYVSALKTFRNFINLKTKIDSFSEKSDALKNFLLDIDCLNPLLEWTKRLNIFDVLKISKTEIRHSNMLAWLTNPQENHGLGDSVLNGFIQYGADRGKIKGDMFKTLLMNMNDFEIRREWYNIDLLAISHKQKFVMCLENKIDSDEHDGQLDRYSGIIDDNFSDYTKLFIYLSPDGSKSSNPELWCSMRYQDVFDIIKKSKERHQLLPEIELLIDNYLDTIRRFIVGDDKIAQICAEIYAKHQRALDLIYEYRPDRALQVAELFREWAIEKTEKKEIIVNLNKCNKTYIRFTTKEMSKVLPPSEEDIGGWNTPDHYFYELVIKDGKNYHFQLVISSINLSEEDRLTCDQIDQFRDSKKKKENWQWWTLYSTKTKKVEEELIKEKIFAQLDKGLAELKDFEKKLIESIN